MGSVSRSALRCWFALVIVAGWWCVAYAQKPFGINLCGAEFGAAFPGVYGRDYIYPTEAEIAYFAQKGFRLVRLPFRWERIQPQLFLPLDTAELHRIQRFVELCWQYGIAVVLDMHNYGRRVEKGRTVIIGEDPVPASAFADVWQRLARVFSTHSGIWAYGLMNEPHDQLPTVPWFDLAQLAITAIRQVDQRTPILIAGNQWSNAYWWWEESDQLRNLIDPANRLIFEAHVYFDRDFSGRYRGSYDTEGAYPDIGVDRLAPFIAWLEFYQLEGFVGEYGVPGDDPRWLEVLRRTLAFLHKHCVNGAYWAAGPWWGDYALSVEPDSTGDKPQMAVLTQFLSTPDSCLTAAGETAMPPRLYPVPVHAAVAVPAPPGTWITVWNLIGKQVAQRQVSDTYLLDLHDLAPGVYVLQSEQQEHWVILKR